MSPKKDEFLRILSGYQGILHKVNLVYFRSQADREDNFQEIIYQLWKSYPNLRKEQSIGSWIYAVAINTSISRIKKNFRMEYRENLPEVTDSLDILEKISMSEATENLLNAIYLLDEVDKSIMLLYLEEKSYDEIAEITGISRNNVGVRINRAKERLKQHIKF